MRGIASLDRDHVLKHLAPEYHSIVESDTVECLTVKALLKRNHIEQIDLLHIDAEGCDWIILQQFDFNLVRPTVVLFERKHLNREDQEVARSMMENARLSSAGAGDGFPLRVKMTVSVVIATRNRMRGFAADLLMCAAIKSAAAGGAGHGGWLQRRHA